jgi:hypothetical protein
VPQQPEHSELLVLMWLVRQWFAIARKNRALRDVTGVTLLIESGSIIERAPFPW